MEFDMVFEGGGAKGIVFVGAIQALEERGHTFGRFIGTSAGAITATMLAAGYDAAGVLELSAEKLPDGRPRFASFLEAPVQFTGDDVRDSLTFQLMKDIDLPLIPEVVEGRWDWWIVNRLMEAPAYRHVFSFVERGGWYVANRFLAWIREKLEAAGAGLGDATLADFHQATKKDLSVVASDISGREMLVLNHRTAPDCPVAYAVRMSMSVPFTWQEVTWREEWGAYRGRDLSGHKVVDGGVLSNFPIGLLLSQSQEVAEVMGTGGSAGIPLGLLMDESLPVPGSGPGPGQGPENRETSAADLQELKIVKRITGLVDTITSAHDRFIAQHHQEHVCPLPVQGYNTLEFDMSQRRIEALIAAGRATMEAYLDGLVVE